MRIKARDWKKVYITQQVEWGSWIVKVLEKLDLKLLSRNIVIVPLPSLSWLNYWKLLYKTLKSLVTTVFHRKMLIYFHGYFSFQEPLTSLCWKITEQMFEFLDDYIVIVQMSEVEEQIRKWVWSRTSVPKMPCTNICQELPMSGVRHNCYCEDISQSEPELTNLQCTSDTKLTHEPLFISTSVRITQDVSLFQLSDFTTDRATFTWSSCCNHVALTDTWTASSAF